MADKNKTCKNCKFLTNVFGNDIEKENIMGGCGVKGLFITTSDKACNYFKERK